MHPASYWRQNKLWKQWLGRKGTVIVSTIIHVASPQQAGLQPMSYAIVDFGDEKAEFMGADHQEFQTGDRVECVLRKTAVSNDRDLIQYGIKIQKVKHE